MYKNVVHIPNPVILPVAIVVITIVASQDNQSSNSQAISKHDLGYRVLPNLEFKDVFTLKEFWKLFKSFLLSKLSKEGLKTLSFRAVSGVGSWEA